MSTFDGIIDVYDENDLDLNFAYANGVRVILHETSQGLFKTDSAYKSRKKAALDKGFLWLGYHLLSDENAEKQLDRLLSIESGADPQIGLAIDWEPSKKGIMPYKEVVRFVQLFNQAMKPYYADRYPVLYGGPLLRETKEIQAGDPVLRNCPLWYSRLTHGELEIPAKTWQTYTLWQFDDDKRKWGGPPANVLPGVDFNRYQGKFEALHAVWPFVDKQR